jgi:hypothetical protein
MFPFTAPYLTQKESSEVIVKSSEIKFYLPLSGIRDKHHTWEVKLTS